MKISCVMPAFNEENLIEVSVKGLILYWSETPYDFQLVVVDDGSRDSTIEILERLREKYENLKVICQRNQGKGQAIRNGILNVVGSDVVYFVDSDMPYSHKDQYRVVSAVANGTCKAALGSRISGDGDRQKSTLFRNIASKGLSMLNKSMLGIHTRDTQCGLKAFDSRLAKSIYNLNSISGFGSDLFVVGYIEKKDISYKIVNVSMLPEQRPSTVKIFHSSVSVFIDLLRTWLMLRKI